MFQLNTLPSQQRDPAVDTAELEPVRWAKNTSGTTPAVSTELLHQEQAWLAFMFASIKYLITLPLYCWRRVRPSFRYSRTSSFSAEVSIHPKCGKNKHRLPNTAQSCFFFLPGTQMRQTVVTALPACRKGRAWVLNAFSCLDVFISIST